MKAKKFAFMRSYAEARADIEAMKSDLAAVRSTLGEAEGSLNSEHYRDAKAKAEAVKEKAATIKSSVEQAMQARQTARHRGRLERQLSSERLRLE